MTTLAPPCASSKCAVTRRGSTTGKNSGAHRAVKVRAAAADDVHAKAVVLAKKKTITASVTAALIGSFSSAFIITLPALAEEAAAAASSSSEISPFAGVVDITVLGVVGLLAVQGNKKAEAAKAQGGNKKKK